MSKSNSSSINFKIVVPVYNSELYIGKCIESLMSQKHSDFTCVIINDASTDKTESIIKEKVGSDKRFIVKNNQERKFALHNTIIGTNLICNNDDDVIVILDGDDWLYDSDSLSYLNHIYKTEDVLATYGGHDFASGGHCSSYYSRELFSRYSPTKHNISHLRSYKYKLFKSIGKEDLVDANGNYFTVTGDMAVMYPIAEMAGSKFKFIDRKVYVYNNLSPTNDYKIKPSDQVLTSQYISRKVPYKILKHTDKIKVGLFDKNFKHCKFCNGDVNDSNYIDWDRENCNNKYTLFTDLCLEQVKCYNKSDGKFLVAWLMEPRAIHPFAYSFIEENYSKFDYVLSHDASILKRVKNSVFVPASCTWIERSKWRLYQKTKGILLIVSDKKITEGHRIKHEILKYYGSSLNAVGSAVKPFVEKSEVLKDYRFCVISQNSNDDFYFTEHIIDCFLTGTIPIFRGCKGIENFFNPDGIIRFENLDDFGNLMKDFDCGIYDKKYAAVMDNFNMAHQFTVIEDYIYLNFIRKLEEGVFLC